VIAHIKAVMARRSIKVGVIMKELGFSALNPSLGLAMNQGFRINDRMIDALADWLRTNPALS